MQCARHICTNVRKRFITAHFENMFWKASKASTKPLFNPTMKEIQMLNFVAFAYLMEKNHTTWNRSFFTINRICFIVEIGLYESFNSILGMGKKPIITMLEEIKLYIMERLFNLNIKGSTWTDYKSCPSIIHILDELKTAQSYLIFSYLYFFISIWLW